jgi:8-oxo-dGTP pyrophosphatase MutT (NUDIX family)
MSKKTLMTRTVRSTDIYGVEYNVPVDQLIWRPAAYAIIVRDSNILLTKQHNAFHLPGGGIELGEMPENGVIREVKEETGVVVSNPHLVGQISGFFTQTWKDRDDLVHVHSIFVVLPMRFRRRGVFNRRFQR